MPSVFNSMRLGPCPHLGPRLGLFRSSRCEVVPRCITGQQWQCRSHSTGRHGAVRLEPHSGLRSSSNEKPYLHRRNGPVMQSPTKIREKEITIPFADIRPRFEAGVSLWAMSIRTTDRLKNFGIMLKDIRSLLSLFVDAVEAGELSKTHDHLTRYNLWRFSDPVIPSVMATHADRIYTNVLFHWVSLPEQDWLEQHINPATRRFMRALFDVADFRHPAEKYPIARNMHRRVIMHVGPTNSGKTHHALRALAAAQQGIYAGPLRLLAHEIWERLNRGQIVPLGRDPERESPSADDVPVDIADGVPAIKAVGNARFARECNLLTGEEVKVVSEKAGLSSCTVEMVNLNKQYDVAVVDEIQLIADPDRGSAWTAAVLGLPAKELHLCGEEASVPIIESMLQQTGDELVVKRYERLTPLIVEDNSLEGDFSKISKGDCVVTFSRSGIFGIKKRIEEKTGLRCAVAYGKLPPENRSEQAALFNAPDTGYDVMVGSDAIGMGLNLKIKRIIFETLRKRSSGNLPFPQIKQIAGRAGRYGMHGSEEAGGFVTTLHSQDLPTLRKALSVSSRPLRTAVLELSEDFFGKAMDVLPPDASFQTAADVGYYVAHTNLPFSIERPQSLEPMLYFTDKAGLQSLRVHDRSVLLHAPIQWQDTVAVGIYEEFWRMYYREMHVEIMKALERNPDGTKQLEKLADVEQEMAKGEHPYSSPRDLELLETLHKITVFYLWMTFRSPVAFSEFHKAHELKLRVEKALDWSLQGIAYGRNANDEYIDIAQRMTERGDIKYQGKRPIFERILDNTSDRSSQDLHPQQII